MLSLGPVRALDMFFKKWNHVNASMHVVDFYSTQYTYVT